MSFIVAIVEDEQEDADLVVDHCMEIGKELGIEITPMIYDSAESLLTDFSKVNPSVLVVDLRLTERAEDRSGWDAVNEALLREVIPVVVYSGYAAEDPEDRFKSALIARLIKGGEGEDSRLHATLSRFIELKRGFEKQKERIVAQFGKLTLETAGRILGEEVDDQLNPGTLAVMGVTRLASYLSTVSPEGEGFPPESVFTLTPPITDEFARESLFLGDILLEQIDGENTRLWVVISPSCDLVFSEVRPRKVEKVLLLRVYRNYLETSFLAAVEPATRRNKLRSHIKSQRAKILKCPAKVFGSAYLVISMKDYETIPYDQIIEGFKDGRWKRIAAILTPYAESFQNLFVRDVSRIGTPVTVTSEEEDDWISDFVEI